MSKHSLVRQLYVADPDYKLFETNKNQLEKRYINGHFVSYYENYYYQNFHLLDLAKEIISNKSKLKSYLSYFSSFCIFIFSPIFILFSSFIHFCIILVKIFKIKYVKSLINKPLCFAFCKTSIRKLEKYSKVINKDFFCIYDDVKLDNLYSVNDKRIGVLEMLIIKDRLKCLLSLSFLRLHFENIIGFYKLSLKYQFSFKFLVYYCKRFGVDSYVWYLLTLFVSQNKVKELYSASTNERYAVFLKRLCELKEISSVCIPHGFSPILKLPNGIFGNTYYAINNFERDYLAKNYSNINFIYDKELSSSLFKVKKSPTEKKRKIVYCTSSRHREEDQKCANKLCSHFNEIQVKLHPADKLSDYSFSDNIVIIESYDEAVCGNIIVTKPSTILVDGTYNDSMCIMLLDDAVVKFDYKFIYPGVRTESTLVATDLEEVISILERYVL